MFLEIRRSRLKIIFQCILLQKLEGTKASKSFSEENIVKAFKTNRFIK